MADCNKCGRGITFAVVENGPEAGKLRPFDEDGSAEGGLYQYAITDSGEKNARGYAILNARFFDDPVEGLEKAERLYRHHFKNPDCSGNQKGSYKKTQSGDLSVVINGVKYVPEQSKEDNGF